MSTRAHSLWRTFQEGNVTSGWFEYQAAVFDLDFCFKSKSEKIDPVGSTVCYEMMKLCTGSLQYIPHILVDWLVSIGH